MLDPLHIPSHLWADRTVRAALDARDIGALFRHVSRLTHASQTRIGAAVGLEQGYVSRIMAGRKVTSIDVLERIADGCRMPDEARMALGLAPRQRSFPQDMANFVHQRQCDPPVTRSWRADVSAAAQLWEGEVNRRDVIRQVAFSSAGYTLPALRWFTVPPPQDVGQSGRRSVGQPDIDTIREMTATYRRLDNQYGGGHARKTVTRYLHQEITPLLTEGHYDPPTGRRLLSAVAELTQLAGWQAYDTADHGAAQRHLTLALNLAHAAGDSVLGAEILAAMSHQATYLGHTGAGVDLARAAGQTANLAGVTVLTAEAFVMEAHAHASAHNESACAHALHQAERTLDRADRSSAPRWLGYFDEAYLSAKFGHCFTALGKPTQAERFAVRSLRMDESYVRGKAFNLALLATVQVQRNEPDRACAIGAEALTLTSQLRSARAAGYLYDLRTQLAPHRRRPAVRHFIHQVDATLGPRRDGYNSPRA
ncbi:helix-turn-helix domain-containing protein [Micromonospora sp. MW-13]|uniref:helix-turn-helix domain-containing protein n=1 Tax=Micromonospora sp. MW-13 TaxID=2094022 RepID=UPI000E435ED4|nr:helix-turn-helix transcriptional regulator [Micromonospora sp. MW-13]